MGFVPWNGSHWEKQGQSLDTLSFLQSPAARMDVGCGAGGDTEAKSMES